MDPKDQVDAGNGVKANASSTTETPTFGDTDSRAIAEKHFTKGDEEFRKQEYNSAIEFYTQGIQVKCKDEELNAKLCGKRAATHFILENYNEVLSDAKSTRVFQPSNMQAMIMGARACVKLNLFEEAIKWCDDGLAIDQENRTLVKLKKIAHSYKQSQVSETGKSATRTETKRRETAIDKENMTSLFTLSLDIAEKVANEKKEGVQYLKLGNAYLNNSDFQQAIDNYKQYKDSCVELNDTAGEGKAYGKLGIAYNSVGKVRKAGSCFLSQLEIAKRVGDKFQEVTALSSLGSLVNRSPRVALKRYEQQLTIAKESGMTSEEGDAYGNIAMLYHGIGRYELAMEYQELNLKIVNERDDRVGQGKAYGNLGFIHSSLKDFKRAIEYHELQLSIAKENGSKIDEACAYYWKGCNLESLGCVKEASECYESCAELFNEIRTRLRSRKNSAFRDEWKINLYNEFKHVYTALRRTLLKLNLELKALSAAEQGRARVLEESLESRYGIRTMEPDLYKYISTNTVFVEIDTDAIYIWLLIPGQPIRFQKKSCPINASKGHDATRFLNNLIFEVNKLIEKRRRGGDEPIPSQLRTLYDIIIGDIVKQFQGDELVIIPCGQLWFAPFTAFMDTDSRYLCESFRIRLAPSLTSLKLIADGPRAHHRQGEALITADPDLSEFKDIFGMSPPNNIPFTKEEAVMIAKLCNVKPLLGKEATKMEFLERLKSHTNALVHIATHGDHDGFCLAPNPIRSSLEPKKKDYIVTTKDVLSVHVEAQLVVLSCCHSGYGKITAEGVVGLARAFLASGARSVLTVLHVVGDKNAFQFMKSFYQHLVGGNSSSKAFKKAIRCLRESAKFSGVEHWVPFALIGDDVTLEFPHSCIR